jgi:hypothetical protein
MHNIVSSLRIINPTILGSESHVHQQGVKTCGLKVWSVSCYDLELNATKA